MTTETSNGSYYTEHESIPGYIMFGFFRFRDGELQIGQCQSVRIEDAEREREALRRLGRKPGYYKYVNGKPVLVLA